MCSTIVASNLTYTDILVEAGNVDKHTSFFQASFIEYSLETKPTIVHSHLNQNVFYLSSDCGPSPTVIKRIFT
jgi:hypothetical protein